MKQKGKSQWSYHWL